MFGGPFLIAATQRLSSGDPVSLDDGYRAFLGDLPLDAVARFDPGALTATIPSGMTPGSYPLRVEGPYGSAVLDAAFAVRTPLPAKLSSDVAAPAKVSLGQTFPVTMTVRNEGDFAAVAVAPSPLTPSGVGHARPHPGVGSRFRRRGAAVQHGLHLRVPGDRGRAGDALREALGVDAGGASLTAPVAGERSDPGAAARGARGELVRPQAGGGRHDVLRDALGHEHRRGRRARRAPSHARHFRNRGGAGRAVHARAEHDPRRADRDLRAAAHRDLERRLLARRRSRGGRRQRRPTGERGPGDLGQRRTPGARRPSSSSTPSPRQARQR